MEQEHIVITDEQKRGMRDAILCQCFGTLGAVAFSSGLMLVYLLTLGMERSRVLTYLALPSLGMALLLVPCALLSDRFGKIRIGRYGAACLAAGFGGLTLTQLWPEDMRTPWTLGCILLYAVGQSAMGSTWFALLSPVVPASMRGRFFGRLRLSWQLCGIIFSAGAAALLAYSRAPVAYQILLGGITLSLVIRIFFFSRIPEIERERVPMDAWTTSLRAILNHRGFMPFCAYVFLLMLFTAGTPTFFGLIEKGTLHLSDSFVVLLGNITMVGALIGFAVAGRVVDRFGTKPAFLVCHFGFALTSFAFVLRDQLSWLPMPWLLGVIHLVTGAVGAASSIAISSEILALIPATNKSLSTSFLSALLNGGMALSGLLGAWALRSGALAESWTLGRLPLTPYDTMLLAYGAMVVLLVVTLGLVPSVIRRADWIPRN